MTDPDDWPSMRAQIAVWSRDRPADDPELLELRREYEEVRREMAPETAKAAIINYLRRKLRKTPMSKEQLQEIIDVILQAPRAE